MEEVDEERRGHERKGSGHPSICTKALVPLCWVFLGLESVTFIVEGIA
jgi:hypothetical protein